MLTVILLLEKDRRLPRLTRNVFQRKTDVPHLPIPIPPYLPQVLPICFIVQIFSLLTYFFKFDLQYADNTDTAPYLSQHVASLSAGIYTSRSINIVTSEVFSKDQTCS